jgi:hypothetical protein
MYWTLGTAASRRAPRFASGSFLRLSLFPLGRGSPVRSSAMLRERKPLGGVAVLEILSNTPI